MVTAHLLAYCSCSNRQLSIYFPMNTLLPARPPLIKVYLQRVAYSVPVLIRYYVVGVFYYWGAAKIALYTFVISLTIF